MQQQGSNSYSYAVNLHASKGALSFARSGVVHDFCFLSEKSALKTKNLLYVRNRIGDFSLFFRRTLGVKAKHRFFQGGRSKFGNFLFILDMPAQPS